MHAVWLHASQCRCAGGVGSAVNELLAREAVVCPVLNLGLPDRYVEHGKRELQLSWVGLDAPGLVAAIRQRLDKLEKREATGEPVTVGALTSQGLP